MYSMPEIQVQENIEVKSKMYCKVLQKKNLTVVFKQGQHHFVVKINKHNAQRRHQHIVC